jgi:hypothetical protein
MARPFLPAFEWFPQNDGLGSWGFPQEEKRKGPENEREFGTTKDTKIAKKRRPFGSVTSSLLLKPWLLRLAPLFPRRRRRTLRAEQRPVSRGLFSQMNSMIRFIGGTLNRNERFTVKRRHEDNWDPQS